MSAATAYEVAAKVEELREKIRRLQAAPRSHLAVLRSAVQPLDEILPSGGVPLGQALELWGEAASGRTSLALRTIAGATGNGRLCAYVDGPRELYPPCAVALGVLLSRLLIVRPKAPGQIVWSGLQLARSGAFACVVVDLTHTGVRLSLAEAKKLKDAAQKSGTALLLLTPPTAPAQGLVRLCIEAQGIQGFSVELHHSRSGRDGQRVLVPWDALYPVSGPVYRYQPPVSPCTGSAPEGPVVSFQRPRTHLLRNGVGLYRTRPGRDERLPALSPVLGG